MPQAHPSKADSPPSTGPGAPATSASRYALDACFLGPYGENDTMLEKLVVEFLRDHVY